VRRKEIRLKKVEDLTWTERKKRTKRKRNSKRMKDTVTGTIKAEDEDTKKKEYDRNGRLEVCRK
jgi:hypothetical protein